MGQRNCFFEDSKTKVKDLVGKNYPNHKENDNLPVSLLPPLYSTGRNRKTGLRHAEIIYLLNLEKSIHKNIF